MNDREPVWRRFYPFASHFHSLGAHRMHYLDQGEGDPVVLVHGNPAWSFMWRELVLALEDSHRVLAPDHVGCGLSDKPPDSAYQYRLAQRVEDLTHFLDSVEPERPLTLILHDWGGPIGLGFAVRRPERVRRIVLLNTAGFHVPGTIHWTLRLIRRSRLLAFAIRRFNLFAQGAVRLGCRQAMHPAVRRGYTAPYDSWDHRIATLRFVQDIPLEPGHPSYEELAEVDRGLQRLRSHPLLICWGMKDFVFDEEFLAEWERRFPGAEVHRFEQGGHYVLEDAPEAVIPPILRFVRREPAS